MLRRHLLVLRPGEKGHTIPESPIAKEVHLQEAFKDHPELIPVSDLGLGRLLVVGRETTVGSGGSVDLLAVDPAGRVVVAEFKRGPENPDSRLVVAQLLEYASSLWGMSYEDFDEGIAQPFFNGDRCTEECVRRVEGLEQAAAVYWADEQGFAFEAFRQGLTTSLSEGELDCVVISSEIDPNTRRVIEFLNATARFRGHCIEVDHFSDEQGQVFVPRAAVVPTKPQPVPAPKTTQENFLMACSEAGRGFFSKLLRYMASTRNQERARGEVTWGTKGFSFHIQVGSAKPRIFYGYPCGAGGHNQDYAQIVTSDLRKAGVGEDILKEYVAGVSGLTVISHTPTGNLTFDVDERADETNTQVLIDAMARLLENVRQRSS